MMRLLLPVIWLCVFAGVSLVETSPYVTRPDIHAPSLKVLVDRLDSQDKDLLFFTPYQSHNDSARIYDLQGHLIWDRQEFAPDGAVFHAHNLHPLDLNGKPHLIYTTSTEIHGPKEVRSVILDNTYSFIDEFKNMNNRILLDGHDFEVIREGRAVLQPAWINHAAYPTDTGTRPIREAVVQVLDFESREVEFEWFSLDDVPVNETCLEVNPFDYFHINTVTVSPTGDYLVAGYHVCTIYLVNATTGSIVWRLGGSRSSFTFIDNYEIRFLHHLRAQPLENVNIPLSLQGKVSNTTHLALSFFDNAWDTYGAPTAQSSSGVVILLDLIHMTAQVVERYPHPGGTYAAMFGSMDLLPNGDRFIGWGSLKEATQFTRSGELVYHVQIGEKASMVGSLRTFKRPWSARPHWGPVVFAYSWVCGWPSVLYASWNGATDIHAWTFYGSDSSDGQFQSLGTVEKDGFETSMKAGRSVRLAYVEAMTEDGEVLGRSPVVKTFVPEVVESRGCSEERCPDTLHWNDTSDTCYGHDNGFLRRVNDQTFLG
ncbi:MAG: hypothetical protein Q9217_004018 [Psora testacea]